MVRAKIVAWILLAVNAWGSSPVPAADRQRTGELRGNIAEDMVAVAFDEREPPLYKGPLARALTALTLTSIASLETRFDERVIRGDCKPWQCDHSGGVFHAVGLMQVHPGPHGLRLIGTKAEQCRSDSDDCRTFEDLAQDEIGQIRSGLHILRTQGYGAFSPAAKAREQVSEWLVKHPVPVTDAQVLQEGIAER
jgi:hypothetical protein